MTTNITNIIEEKRAKGVKNLMASVAMTMAHDKLRRRPSMPFRYALKESWNFVKRLSFKANNTVSEWKKDSDYYENLTPERKVEFVKQVRSMSLD